MATMLFPLTTIVERYLGFLNKALLLVVALLLLIETIRDGRINKRSLIFLLISLFTFIISLCITPLAAIKANPNMAVYYIFLLLYYMYFTDHISAIEKELLELREYIFIIVLSFSLFLTLTIFLPNSRIIVTAGGWGDARYFASFSNSPNRVGPACLFIMVLLIYLLRFGKKRKWLFLLLLPHLYAGIAGGSRTYLILIASAALLYFYFWLHPLHKFWITIFPITLIFIYFISKSAMMTKLTISLSYLGTGNTYQFWRRLSNSRSVLWPERINAYKSFSLFNKLIGKGVNYTTYTFGMWSHSDYIEILCSYGVVGVVNYCYVMINLYNHLVNRDSSKLTKFLVLFIWLFNAIFNFFYCYFNSVLCYPILCVTLQDYIFTSPKIVYIVSSVKRKTNCKQKLRGFN